MWQDMKLQLSSNLKGIHFVSNPCFYLRNFIIFIHGSARYKSSLHFNEGLFYSCNSLGVTCIACWKWWNMHRVSLSSGDCYTEILSIACITEYIIYSLCISNKLNWGGNSSFLFNAWILYLTFYYFDSYSSAPFIFFSLFGWKSSITFSVTHDLPGNTFHVSFTAMEITLMYGHIIVWSWNGIGDKLQQQ